MRSGCFVVKGGKNVAKNVANFRKVLRTYSQPCKTGVFRQKVAKNVANNLTLLFQKFKNSLFRNCHEFNCSTPKRWQSSGKTVANGVAKV